MPDRTPFTRHRRTRQLDAYWDAVVEGDQSTPIVPINVDRADALLVRRMQSLASSPTPDPDFATRLEQNLMNTFLSPTPSPLTEILPGMPQPRPSRPPSRNGSRHPDPISRRRSLAPPSRAGWSLLPAVAVGLVILLVLVSIGGVWFTNSRQDEPHRMMAPIVATPGPEASPDVPMYRANPERTGVMPGPGIDGQPVELWRAEIGGSINSAPAIVDGVLYIGAGDGGVYAFDTATGEEVWQFTGTSPIQSSPAAVDGIVYVGSEDGTLYAIDAATGDERWSAPGARPDASVAIVGGMLYTGSADGFLYALDIATGDERWRAPLNEAASRSPAVSDSMVYIGSADGVLHTFDAGTGEPGWEMTRPGDGNLATTVVTGGVVYQTTFGGEENFYLALDADTGEEVWRFATESGDGFYPAATDGQTVYAVSDDASVYALDAATGDELWRFVTSGRIPASPALVDDTLYVAGTDGFLYALDADSGEEAWRFTLEGQADYGPIVVDGVAYVGTSFGYLYAVGGNAEPVMATPAATPAGSTVTQPVASPGTTPIAVEDMTVDLAWQSTGGPDALLAPSSPAFDSEGNLWVVDTGNNRLQIFTQDGKYLETWGAAGDGDGQFNFYRTPNDPGDAVGEIAFAPDGSFYISSAGNKRIQHFAADRTFIRGWGSEGTGDGQFLDPYGIAVATDGNVYVVDDMRNDIQVFDPEGAYLFTFGGRGREPGQLLDPGSLTIDPDGNIWVADWGNNRVQQFAADGTFIGTFGEFGQAEGKFINPEVLAVDQAGNVYVTEPKLGRVQVFTADGEFLMAWSAADDGQGELTAPVGITVDVDGGVYVTDLQANTFQKFEVTLPATPDATPVT